MRLSREAKSMAGGILVGGALGAAGLVAGILFAPKSGRELRSAIGRKARRIWDKI